METEDLRIVINVSEETHARWKYWAERQGFSLNEWIYQVCQVASDPDADNPVLTPEPEQEGQ